MSRKTVRKKAQTEGEENSSPSSVYLNRYQSRFSFEMYLNRPIFKIFSDYFNILKESEEMQKEHEIKVLGFMRDNEFRDNIALDEGYGQKFVTIEFRGLIIEFIFDLIKSGNELFYYLAISSNEKTNINDEAFYKKVWAHAVNVSDLKGSYFTMERDDIYWTKRKLEKRNFSDIYLPKSIIDDLKLYVEANAQAGKIMRYLMAGSPGTGKTESTLVLANELNKLGVTIIKTPICSAIKEKVELAAMLAPSLIIFDDIDLSLGARNKGVYSERLQDFLDIMDGTDKLGDNVGVVATTNSVALLDLAAQRPGRFDKTLVFDELTKTNIKDIILKSLKYKFKINSTSPVAKMFTDASIINLFHTSNSTGAHIYNSVHMLKMRAEFLKLKLSTEFIIEELKKEIKIMEKTRNADFLQDKLNNSASKTIGFGLGSDLEESEDEDGD